jgi:cytoskeletal protein CcmA (bactofilin family)
MKGIFYLIIAAVICFSFAYAEEPDVAGDVADEPSGEEIVGSESETADEGPEPYCPPIAVEDKDVSFGDYNTGKTISGSYVVMPEGEIYDEGVLVVGAVVEVHGDVKGDLICFGAEIYITGTVEGNLLVGASTVVIDGIVNGSSDIFCASARLNGVFNGPVEIGSASARLNGVFNGDVEAGSGVTFAGGVFNAGLTAESAQVYVKPGAIINGDLNYSGELDLADTAMISGETVEIVYEDTEAPGEVKEEFNLVKAVAAWLGWRVFWFLSTMLTAFLLFLVRPSLLSVLPDTMRGNLWQSPLAGIGAVFTSFVIGLVLLISVIGVPSWATFNFFLLILTYLSWIWGGTFIGNLILKPIFKEKGYPVLFASAVGIFILVILGGIPILKVLVHGLVIVFGWGGLVVYLWDSIKGRKVIS